MQIVSQDTISSEADDFLSLHRGYLATIKSISGSMVTYQVDGIKQVPVVKQQYWRRGEWVRCSSIENGDPPYEWMRREGMQFAITTIETQENGKKLFGSIKYVDMAKHTPDFWGEAMCVLPYGNRPLDGLLKQGFKVTRVRMAPHWDIVWENTEDKSTIIVSLSPNHGFGIRSFEWNQNQKIANGKTRLARAVYEVQEFQEPMPGLFFPATVASKNTTDGVLIAQHLSKFENIKINLVIPDNRFVLSIPRGTTITDEIRSESYPVDENWLKMGSSTPVLSPPKAPPAETPPQTVTPPEPTFPWWGWPLLGLLFALLLGGAIYWRRRQK
jgi:hypothetical protein